MGTCRKKFDFLTSFEVDVQLTFTENKWARSEQPSLNERPEKKIAKKAISSATMAVGDVGKGVTYGPI